jgi:hypothetical protein
MRDKIVAIIRVHTSIQVVSNILAVKVNRLEKRRHVVAGKLAPRKGVQKEVPDLMQVVKDRGVRLWVPCWNEIGTAVKVLMAKVKGPEDGCKVIDEDLS